MSGFSSDYPSHWVKLECYFLRAQTVATEEVSRLRLRNTSGAAHSSMGPAPCFKGISLRSEIGLC